MTSTGSECEFVEETLYGDVIKINRVWRDFRLLPEIFMLSVPGIVRRFSSVGDHASITQ